ncbi:hypothetical protein ACFE04_018149 [Oxalis oulophora]
MGNCGFKGFGEVEEMVKVVTSNGGIMELYAPIIAESITNEFQGHAIYRTNDFLSQPLLHNEHLHAGQLYYLLPVPINNKQPQNNTMNINNIGNNPEATPYRMSFDRVIKRPAEVLPRYNGSGVWKVRLVISPEQLAEILTQETRTEALIESVRTVAKCSNGGVAASVARLDQWSVADSWKS